MKFIPKNFVIPELRNIDMEETKIKYFTLQTCYIIMAFNS